jgi:CRISPR-associated endonuclease Cas1
VKGNRERGIVSHNFVSSSIPRSGIVTVHGYGLNVHVNKGHLLLEDGIGPDRRRRRLSRVGHGLKRLVVIGSDGTVSLAALRWLADQSASFVMLDRDGTIHVMTGPVRSSDTRLRRAQALAHQTGLAFRISRELIDRKLAGQERVARELLRNDEAGAAIREFRSELGEVESIDHIRITESRAAKAYWKAWQVVPIKFPDRDIPRVPEHWRNFGSRVSPLSGSPRLATNPINAILNYLYALLEAECRLAAAVLGLDPGMGVLHMDSIHRDSLACDLMEPLRPDVDAHVLSWVLQRPLKRSWFFEERSGNCRLMADLTSQLSQTALTWARLAAPLAEWAAKEIASTAGSITRVPATRLTQNHKRALSGRAFTSKSDHPVNHPKMCGICGKEIQRRSKRCLPCLGETLPERLRGLSPKGRVLSHTEEAEAKRAKTQLANHRALLSWSPSDQPSWLTSEFFKEMIHPSVESLSVAVIAHGLGVSRGYAIEIRRGRVPHPRHWLALAKLAGKLG